MAKYRESEYFPAEPTEAVQDSASDVRSAIYAGTDTDQKLFDVTAVIGSIYRGGQFSPRVAAFMLIADHDADGEYTFPDEDGSTIMVGVYTAKVKADG